MNKKYPTDTDRGAIVLRVPLVDRFDVDRLSGRRVFAVVRVLVRRSKSMRFTGKDDIERVKM